MPPFLIAIIVIGYIVYFIIKTTAKQQRQRGQSSNIPPNTGQNVFDILAGNVGNQNAGSQQARSNQGSGGTQNPQAFNNPVEESELHWEDDPDHFSETSLVEEYKRMHGKGKTIQHHTHDYFDEETDKKISPTKAKRSKPHPILSSLNNERSLKRAVAISEVLKRKF